MSTGYEEVFNVSEVAKIFKVRATTVRRMIRDGELPAIRVGRRYRVPKSAIDRYFALPALTAFSPEDMGFGMWEKRADIGDSVEYVNMMRSKNDRSLRETAEEIDEWEREQASS